ncbi:MAG: glycyl-radical enzyme activating protein [Oscillospiraceae bacterium]
MEENKVLIFNILRGSLVDGHGIRTTVFLKGCPLRCLWCCNVEGQQTKNELKVTAELCNGCGDCVDICPNKAITVNPEAGGEILRIDREKCTGCGTCAAVCYREALQSFGRYYTVDEIFDIVRKDERAYRLSGGGVTIAGGEATMFPRFTLALIEKCKEEYIHTAIDTCGYTVSDESFECLRQADLLLYDLKHMDSAVHKKLTGVPNERILENLIKLNDMRKDIIIRIPVIPGFNDSEENLRASAKFISELKSVERVDLIGYHNYSKKKYVQLGKEYPLTMPAADDEYMKKVKGLFDEYGLNVQLGG